MVFVQFKFKFWKSVKDEEMKSGSFYQLRIYRTDKERKSKLFPWITLQEYQCEAIRLFLCMSLGRLNSNPSALHPRGQGDTEVLHSRPLFGIPAGIPFSIVLLSCMQCPVSFWLGTRWMRRAAAVLDSLSVFEHFCIKRRELLQTPRAKLVVGSIRDDTEGFQVKDRCKAD